MASIRYDPQKKKAHIPLSIQVVLSLKYNSGELCQFRWMLFWGVLPSLQFLHYCRGLKCSPHLPWTVIWMERNPWWRENNWKNVMGLFFISNWADFVCRQATLFLGQYVYLGLFRQVCSLNANIGYGSLLTKHWSLIFFIAETKNRAIVCYYLKILLP